MRRFSFFIASVLLLSACTATVQERREGAQKVVNNVTRDVKNLQRTAEETAEMAKKGIETAKDLKARADKVANGIKQVKEGLAGN